MSQRLQLVPAIEQTTQILATPAQPWLLDAPVTYPLGSSLPVSRTVADDGAVATSAPMAERVTWQRTR